MCQTCTNICDSWDRFKYYWNLELDEQKKMAKLIANICWIQLFQHISSFYSGWTILRLLRQTPFMQSESCCTVKRTSCNFFNCVATFVGVISKWRGICSFHILWPQGRLSDPFLLILWLFWFKKKLIVSSILESYLWLSRISEMYSNFTTSKTKVDGRT